LAAEVDRRSPSVEATCTASSFYFVKISFIKKQAELILKPALKALNNDVINMVALQPQGISMATTGSFEDSAHVRPVLIQWSTSTHGWRELNAVIFPYTSMFSYVRRKSK
jgi:hypothetical protein